MIGDLDWRQILMAAVKVSSQRLAINGDTLVVDNDILSEVEAKAHETVASYGKKEPNLAKSAGHITFWIRKLKPITYSAKAREKYLAINEYISVVCALAICDASNVRAHNYRSVMYRLPHA